MTPYSDRAGRDARRPAAPALTPGAGGTAAGVASAASGQRSAAARLPRPQRWCLAALIAALDVALAGPLVGRGSLHLLDFGDYPQSPHPAFAPSAFGFPPGITSRAPIDVALYWLFQGVHWSPLFLLPFAAVAPLAVAGFARVFPGQGLAIAAATVLFTVNPFIDERMASGQVYVVMGYSLLPIILGLAVRPLDSVMATSALGGLVLTVAVAESVHYLFIGGLLLLVTAGTFAALGQARAARAAAGIAACGAVLNLYWLIPAARATRTMPSRVSHADLAVFQTVADRTWGLAVNIAGLYGFWRPGPPLVQDVLSGWPFLLLTMLLVAGFGFFQMWSRGGPSGRALAASCAIAVLAGGLLAAGAQGPAGGLYTWLFNHLPGFRVMREPDKFAALLALGYAAGFGAGAAAMTRRMLARNWSRVLCVGCLMALPLVYGYTELWGFGGYARPVSYPASWAAADRAMSPGATAIALPWRSYLPVPWNRGAVTANPMQGYFDRPMIIADDLEAGPITTETSDPRSLFLQFCLGHGKRLTEFGRLLAPLGIRYVILAKGPWLPSFGWLSQQRDLRKVFGSASIAVYRNQESVPRAYEPHQRIVLRDWGQVVALAQRAPLIDYLIQVRRAGPGPIAWPAGTAVPPPVRPTVLAAPRGTPVAQPVVLGRPARSVIIVNPAYQGWRLAGYRTASQFGVTVAFTGSRRGSRRGTRRGTHAGTAVAGYQPWRLAAAADLAGGGLAAADVALFVAASTRRRRRAGTAAGRDRCGPGVI
jgi:hypothetical protein